MAGYSGTPLPKKLGIKTGHRLAFLGAPPYFSQVLGSLPERISVVNRLVGGAPYDVIVFFTSRHTELAARFAELVDRLATGGGLWIAWPKQASKVPTDVTEDVVRGTALAAGLVDNKVCAIDETWSGLRIVRRVEKR